MCTLSGVLSFTTFCLVTIFVPPEEIGQKTWTSLSLKLNHFRDFWTCLEGKINHLLQEQWPTPNVGWPEEGTFEPPLSIGQRRKAMGHRGTWLRLLISLPDKYGGEAPEMGKTFSATTPGGSCNSGRKETEHRGGIPALGPSLPRPTPQEETCRRNISQYPPHQLKEH